MFDEDFVNRLVDRVFILVVWICGSNWAWHFVVYFVTDARRDRGDSEDARMEN